MAQQTIKKTGSKRVGGESTTKSPALEAERDSVSSNTVGLPVIAQAFEEQSPTNRDRDDSDLALGDAAHPRAEGGWLSTVGMFTGDEDMLEISKEISKIRNKRR